MKENEAYAQAHNEIETNSKDIGLWAKALSQSDNNIDRATSAYLRLRAENLCGYKEPRIKFPKWVYLLWIPQGRRGRGSWLLWGIAHILLIGLLGAPFSSDSSTNSPIVDLWFITLMLMWIYLTIVNAAKRFHDLNVTGWLAPIVFFPLVPLFMLLLSGTKGMNKYGESTQGFLS